MRIVDNDAKGTRGGTLYEFESGVQIRLCALIAGEYDETLTQEVTSILDTIITHAEAYKRWQISRRKG